MIPTPAWQGSGHLIPIPAWQGSGHLIPTPAWQGSSWWCGALHSGLASLPAGCYGLHLHLGEAHLMGGGSWCPAATLAGKWYSGVRYSGTLGGTPGHLAVLRDTRHGTPGHSAGWEREATSPRYHNVRRCGNRPEYITVSLSWPSALTTLCSNYCSHVTAILPNSRTLDGYPLSVKTGQQLYKSSQNAGEIVVTISAFNITVAY